MSVPRKGVAPCYGTVVPERPRGHAVPPRRRPRSYLLELLVQDFPNLV